MEKKAVGYIRVSTFDQAREGISLEAQRDRIEKWADLHEYKLIAVFDDAGLSAKALTNRPGVKAALDLACKERCALVSYSLSRLARTVRDAIGIAERLNKAKADLVLLAESIDTTTVSGRAMFGMLAVFAQFERETVAERTRLAMAHKRMLGQRISRRIPFGFDLATDQRTLVLNPQEQGAIAIMKKLNKEGRSLREICRELEKRKIAAKSGDVKWSAPVVSGILRRSVA